MAAHIGIPLNITGGTGKPEQVFGEIVTGNYFTVLGARPLVGRTFLPDEDRQPGEKLVCVLGYGEWQKCFGGDPAIVGRTVTLNERSSRWSASCRRASRARTRSAAPRCGCRT